MSEEDSLDLLLRGLCDFSAEDESSTHRGDDLSDHDSSSSSRPRTVNLLKLLGGMRCVRSRQVDYKRVLTCPIYSSTLISLLPSDGPRLPKAAFGDPPSRRHRGILLPSGPSSPGPERREPPLPYTDGQFDTLGTHSAQAASEPPDTTFWSGYSSRNHSQSDPFLCLDGSPWVPPLPSSTPALVTPDTMGMLSPDHISSMGCARSRQANNGHMLIPRCRSTSPFFPNADTWRQSDQFLRSDGSPWSPPPPYSTRILAPSSMSMQSPDQVISMRCVRSRQANYGHMLTPPI